MPSYLPFGSLVYPGPGAGLTSQQTPFQPPGGNLLSSNLYADLLDPQRTVRHVLRQMGYSPYSADPRIRAVISNAGGLMMPVFARMAANPDAGWEPVQGWIREQVQNALAGGGVLYSPQQGRYAIDQLRRTAYEAQQAASRLGGWQAIDPVRQFIGQLMANDQLALGVLQSMMTGGLSGRAQRLIERSYELLPETAEHLTATYPWVVPQNPSSFLDILLSFYPVPLY